MEIESEEEREREKERSESEISFFFINQFLQMKSFLKMTQGKENGT